jgi:hypothetical protein
LTENSTQHAYLLSQSGRGHIAFLLSQQIAEMQILTWPNCPGICITNLAKTLRMGAHAAIQEAA